ncbi:hypothetical protein EDB92DRAFT_1885663 [Lactarius akahatsu]|uniref:UvrD-like helicase ATP-binding domain-containing protein n=1 Tax=Lactarius akahatsu TaxID=416441 RepID=A0AAD4L9M4_9AGAM|nr:hypothetical protein EDB92DRAFT_1885663 [Lactarius akahatsu]
MSRSTGSFPRHSSMPKGFANFEWFKPELLKHLGDEGVDVALESVQQFVRPDTLSFVFEVALELRGCTELLLSSLSQDRFTVVLNWVENVFPHNLDNYSPKAICPRLLSTISVSLLFLQSPNEDGLPQDLDASHQYVVHSNSVLQALVTIIQSPSSGIDGVSSDEEAFPMTKRKKGSQKAQKHARRGRQTSKPVDPTPFLALRFEVPSSHGEAKEMALGILSKQKSILTSHLCLFRLESLSEILKRNYIPSAVVDAAVEDNGALANRSVQDIEILEEVPAAYPQVQPMKAALYFDSVDGFGQWRILISGRADRNLREMRKKDANLFRITLKKIKELSNGHFSDDNHKRLTGTSISVPIYEAKMTRDSRLVYQVDCVPDFNTIKVFGVYTHAQLDKRLWDSMGHQLSRKGKEYQRRCTFRSEPVHKGDKVVPPASFPAAPPPDAKMIPDELPIVSDEVLGEVRILADQEVVHVFQVSPHEQEIIENAHSCFVQGRSGTGKTTTMLFKMLGMENSWQQNRELRPNRPRQLFVTQSRMLADKVEEYFIKLLQSLVLASKTEGGISDLLERQKNREEAGLVDQDEAMNWREDLPQRFSDLQDTHFPMFITFDKLSAMIEADMSHPPGIVTEDELGAGQQAESSEYMLQRRKSFISFDVFQEEYWAHFPQSLTKGIGVIKGSEMTLDSETHFLDHETYLNLSARTQATFASKRKEIYVLFETYLKMKRDRREYDAADRTHAILRSMVQDGMKGQKIDFLYVDEVQDNLLIDAKVLRAICCNPDGQFWAGDTAQTISVGSSFRFDDLKAFLHRNEERMKQQFIQTTTPHQPRSFQLVTNFRSHGGIVRCAHSVIVLITKFWPYAIDILPEEKGIVDGIKPVFFSGWDQDNVRYESFLFGTAGHHIEFGAQQCILVRNDAAREKLRKQVGNIGLIMTLYESKGLEFNDVLLYNFFEDSTVDVSQWRVVLNAIDRAQRAKIPAPTFDENRHAGVCSELKFLYVAITRARKNLWVVDRSETAEPMRIYWASNDLFQNCTPGADVPQLAVSSSPEEWAKMARTLFSHKRYFQAMHSYERAGMLREKAIAHAYHLREQARGIPFLASARDAIIFRERSEYYRIAAEAFLVLEDHAQAAQAFEKASKFTEAAQNYRRAGMFDATVSVIQNHGDAMDSSVASQLTDVARYYYLQRGDLKKARDLFSGPEEELEFVRDCDLDIAEVNILVEAGRFREAADLHIRENRVLDAVEVLLKDKNSREATQLATQKLLDALWSTLSFGVTPDILDGDAQAKLRKIKQLIERLNVRSLDSKAQQEFQMFEAIGEANTAQLMALGWTFHQEGNKPAALLCLDHSFQNFNTQILQSYSDSQVLNMAVALHGYARLVQEIIFSLDPWDRRHIRKLFSFSIQSNGRICLPRGTFLHDCSQRSLRKPSSDDIAVEVRYFYELYRYTLRERLRKLLDAYCDGCLSVRVFDPCEASAAGRCDRADCTRHHKLDRTWFDRRLWFHIYLVDFSILLPFFGGDFRYQRIWPERLYETMNPMHISFGSSMNVELRLTSRTFDLLRTHWIWPNLYSLEPYQPKFLSTLLRLVDLGSFVDNKALVDFVYRTSLVQIYSPPFLMREERDGYVILDLLEFLRGDKHSSIHAGAMFIRHILDKKIPVEITMLCRFMELVVGSFIIAWSFRKTGSLHGVTLPRSWMLENVRKLHKVQNKDAHPHFAFTTIDLFQDLLENIYTGGGADHLLHQNKPLSFVSVRVRNFALARLCRIVCLLGFNFRRTDLRARVLGSITSLRKTDPNRMFSSLFSQYVHAQDWSRLAVVVTSSIPQPQLDEMVTMVDESRNAPHTFPGVHPIKFRDADDIGRKLSFAADPASTLNPAASPFIPTQARAQANDAQPPVEAPTEANEAKDPIPEDNIEEEDTEPPPNDADVATIIGSIGTKVSKISEEDLAKQHHAAKTLQSYYRRLQAKRANQIAHAGLGLPKARKDRFEAFAQAASTIEWPERSLYRRIFLGALPHLLLCLDHTRTIVMDEKAKVKRSARSNGRHQEIEDLMKRQTKLNTIIKRIQGLQAELKETSNIHKPRDLKVLEAYVGLVATILDEVPRAKEELDFDMTMASAWRRHVNESRKPKVVEKPELNTDDLDLMYVY